MSNPTLLSPFFHFLNGASAMGACTCGLFFLRFWHRTRDRLFLIFGLAFWLLAADRIISVFHYDAQEETRSAIYLIRLLAFLMILGGIWDKNRSRRSIP
jgi:hypothetical protein